MLNQKKKFNYLIPILVLIELAIHAKEPKVFDKVDLNKFQGNWYEIARFPNPFQNNCKQNVSAKYRILENNEIEVINSCVEKNGQINRVKGIARLQDKESSSKLEVSFFDIFGWRPVWGDYWILYIDPNYELAVIGDRNSKYGWVLSRKQTLSSVKIKRVETIFDQNYYDSSKLTFTKHE